MSRTVWLVRGWLLILSGVLTVILVNSRQAAHKNAEHIDSICKSFASVGNLDIAPTATKTGVFIVVEHRNAAILLGCGDLLDEPSDILKQKVKQFNVRLDG